MVKILLFIKKNFGFLWRIIDWVNGTLYKLFFSAKQVRILQELFKNSENSKIVYRKLIESDIQSLFELIASQPASDLDYFKPHGFDIQSLKTQFKNPSFLMMGAFDDKKITGYFFLRFFVNKKCFVGRLIDHKSRGRGIGKGMNIFMYEIAWRMGFKCLSTISRNNKAVMRAHSNNQSMLILKELKDDYLLVEFVRADS